MMSRLKKWVTKAVVGLLLFASCATCWAEVPIPPEYHMYNRSGSQCVFCSLETLAYWLQIEELYGLTDTYKHATGPGFIGQLLTRKGVPHHQAYGRDPHQLAWAQWAVDNQYGCLIGVNNGTHAVVLIELTETEAVIIENGVRSQDKRVRMSRERFNRKFSGWVCVIWKENK